MTKTTIQYGDTVQDLKLQVGQALIALSALEAEIVGDMRQSVLLDIIQQQRNNINDCAAEPAF